MLQNNLAQQQSLIGRLSDQQLTQELAKPSGIAPSYLVMGEMQKRQQMRSGAGSQGPSSPVKQQLLQNAIKAAPTMAEAAPPANGQGAPIAGPQMINQAAPPQGGIPGLAQMSHVASPMIRPPAYDPDGSAPSYAQGGIVGITRYADGDIVQADGRGPDNNLDALILTAATPKAAVPMVRPQYSPLPPPDAPGGSFGPWATDSYKGGPSAADVVTGSQGFTNQILANQGIRTPDDSESYSNKVMNQWGGKEAFQAPYDPAIKAYQQQIQSSNPVSQALIKAGAAMMQAPNGSVLAGLGAGLNSGSDAYQAAMNQQRAIQDKLVNAQMNQGNSVLQGQERASMVGGQNRQQDISLYDSASAQAAALARQAMLVPVQNQQLRSSDAQFDVQTALRRQEIAVQQTIAEKAQQGQDDRQTQTLIAGIPGQANEAAYRTAQQFIANEKAMRQSKNGGMPLTPQQISEAENAGYAKSQSQATHAAFSTAKSLMATLNIPAVLPATDKTGKQVGLQWNPIIAPYVGALDPNKPSDRAFAGLSR